jgi:peptidoglycan hydrolase-like protein with peptidoglycan-binding domain
VFDVNLRGIAFAILLSAPLSAAAAGEFTALHPEEAYPDPKGQPSLDAYSGLVSKVQEKLRELGFGAGPINGDFGAKTQAALAQFQLSRTIPASGQLDNTTLAELGVQRERSDAQQTADNKSDAEQNADKSDNAQGANSGASVANDSAEKTPSSEKTGN